jgi:alkylation response protein AidB-like acyl-CoA dehydrogenase
MDFELSDAQTALRDHARRTGATAAASVRDRDRAAAWDPGLFVRMGSDGLLGGPIPSKYGGQGLDGLGTCLQFEGFGDGSTDLGLVTAWAAHTLACAVPLWKFGTEEQKDSALPALVSGRWVGALASTGRDTGFDLERVQVRATRSPGGWTLNGTSVGVVNAPVADLLLTVALTAPGRVTVFLVDPRAPGVHVESAAEPGGQRTSCSAEVVFRDCFLAPDRVLGEVGGGLDVVGVGIRWHWSLCPAAWTGVQDALFAHCVRYVQQAEQFGRPMKDFQAVRVLLVDMKMRRELGRRLTYRASWLLDRGVGGAGEAAQAKLFVAEGTQRTVRDAVQLCSAQARRAGELVERLVRDTMLLSADDNTVSVLRSVVASQFLDLSEGR